MIRACLFCWRVFLVRKFSRVGGARSGYYSECVGVLLLPRRTPGVNCLSRYFPMAPSQGSAGREAIISVWSGQLLPKDSVVFFDSVLARTASPSPRQSPRALSNITSTSSEIPGGSTARHTCQHSTKTYGIVFTLNTPAELHGADAGKWRPELAGCHSTVRTFLRPKSRGLPTLSTKPELPAVGMTATGFGV